MGRKVWVPVVSGPLAPYAAGFALWLRSRAYSPSAAADRLWSRLGFAETVMVGGWDGSRVAGWAARRS